MYDEIPRRRGGRRSDEQCRVSARVNGCDLREVVRDNYRFVAGRAPATEGGE